MKKVPKTNQANTPVQCRVLCAISYLQYVHQQSLDEKLIYPPSRGWSLSLSLSPLFIRAFVVFLLLTEEEWDVFVFHAAPIFRSDFCKYREGNYWLHASCRELLWNNRQAARGGNVSTHAISQLTAFRCFHLHLSATFLHRGGDKKKKKFSILFRWVVCKGYNYLDPHLWRWHMN